jgi:hypothetical protein
MTSKSTFHPLGTATRASEDKVSRSDAARSLVQIKIETFIVFSSPMEEPGSLACAETCLYRRKTDRVGRPRM